MPTRLSELTSRIGSGRERPRTYEAAPGTGADENRWGMPVFI